MTVALSSLRVTSDLDASGYARGAAQKVAADQAMIASDKARNASLAQADAALERIPSGMASVSKSLLDGYGAGAQFEAIVRRIGNSVDRGMGLDRAGVLLDAAYRKFGLTADAAVLAERGFVSLAPAIEQVTKRYDVMAESARRAEAQQESTSKASNFQSSLNATLGLGAAPATGLGASFEALASKGEQAEKQAQALRNAINPLDAEFVRLGKDIANYRRLLDDGLISSQEFEQAQQLAGKRLSDVDMNMRKAATGGRVLSGELGNLGYQVNDVITGLALGQPVFMIAAQQGGQIYQIFSRSRASVAEFAGSFISSVAGMVTPGRAAFTVVAGSIAFATGALVTYEGKLNEVQRKLTGMGRASGASAIGIDAIAQQSATPTGLSVNEARNLATELAATGKIGVDSIAPIVAIGHDFAKTFGVDAKEAAELLAKAFSDPVAGADELNKRLGFLDANTKILISSLVTQGNRTEAIRILTDKVKGSIADAADITSFWARAGTSAGNALSDFFDRTGRSADRIFGSGHGLDEKINNLTIQLLELEKAKLSNDWINIPFMETLPEKMSRITAEIERLNNVRNKQLNAASPETKDKQRALEIDEIARATLPTIDATRKLRDETLALQEAFDRPELQKYVTLVGTDLVLAYQRKKAAEAAMIGADPIRNQIADSEAQIQALDRRSISDRARFAREAEARRQSLDPNAGSESERLEKQNQAARLAAGGITALDNQSRQLIATRGVMASVSDRVRDKELELDNLAREGITLTDRERKGLLDLAREQALGVTSMKQQADSTRIQAETLGMSTGKAAEHTAVQTRLAEAMRNKQVLTAEDIAQIRAQAGVLGEVTQAAEKARIAYDISFGARTSLLSPDDVQIAQQLKGLYPDVATALSSVEATGLRTNAALSGLSSSMSGTLTTGLADITDGTKSISAGAGDMSKAFIRAIEEMIIKIAIVTPLMRALQIAAGSLGGGLMGGGSPSGYGPGPSAVTANANGNAFDGSNVVPFARGGSFTNGIFDAPTLFRFARGGALANGVLGEAGPEAVMPLRRGNDGRLGVAMTGGASGGYAAPNIQFNVNTLPGTTADQGQFQSDGRGGGQMEITIKKMVEGIGVQSIASGDMGRAMEAKYGSKAFAGS